MIVIDGAAIVNIIKPFVSATFAEYVTQIMGYLRSQFTGSVRMIDVIFDVYKPDSLKTATRKKRGKGIRIRVEGQKKEPGNWPTFLREDGNKTELFNLISDSVANENFPGKVIITHEEEVRYSEPTDTKGLSPCTHEEADTRMLLHAADGSQQGFKRIVIRTVDTDVVVLAVSLASRIGCENLCVAFGTGKSFRYLNVSAIANMLGTEKCDTLPAFHALTGCDTTSCFASKGKRIAWSTWSAFNDVTPAFCILTHTPSPDEVKEVLPTIERFIVLMYDRSFHDPTDTN